MQLLTDQTKTKPDIDFDRAIWDLPYYARNLLWVKHKSAGPGPFILNHAQKLLWYGRPKDYETNRIYRHAVIPEEGWLYKILHDLPILECILKYRQGGTSTECMALAFQKVHTSLGKKAMVVAHDKETSEHLLEMAKMFYDYLPHDWQPKLANRNARELTFANLRSSISIETAGHMGSGHGRTCHVLICCLAGSTLIELQDGVHVPISEIKVGDIVRTHTGATAALRAIMSRPVEEVSKGGRMIAVTVWGASADPLKVTPDHQVWTRGGWQPARNLKVGDEVAYPLKPVREGLETLSIRCDSWVRPQGGGRDPLEGDIPLDRGFGFFVGYYLAEGSLGRSSRPPFKSSLVNLSHHVEEQDFADQAIKSVEQFVRSTRTEVKPGTASANTVLYGAALAQTVLREFGHKDGKVIPDWVFDAGQEFLRGILEGFEAGDGSKPQEYDVRITSVRKHLLVQLRWIAASLGIAWASIRKWQEAGTDDRGWNHKVAWSWSLPSGSFWHWRRSSLEEGVAWVKIRDIQEYSSDELVYDIEVDHPDHSFVTASGAVKNSELARWEFPEYVLDGLLETVPTGVDAPGTAIIFESTAEWASDYFYDAYHQARAGDSGYDAAFLPWYLCEWYREPVNPDIVLPKEYLEMQKEYGLDDEQVAWYISEVGRQNMKRPGKGEKFIRRLYPATQDEAFITAGLSVYPEAALDNQKLKTRRPIAEGDILGDKIVWKRGGRLKIWEKAREDSLYLIGADVASGVAKSQSAVEVFAHPGYRQVAEWASEHVDPRSFAHVIKPIGEHYNNAIAAVEVNNGGILTISELEQIYGYVYKWKYFNRKTSIRTQITGWNTNHETKSIMVKHMCSLLNEKPPRIIIRSPDLLSQMRLFQEYPGDKYQPAPGARGDLNMACLIACIALYQEYARHDMDYFFGADAGEKEEGDEYKWKGNTDDWNPGDARQGSETWMNS